MERIKPRPKNSESDVESTVLFIKTQTWANLTIIELTMLAVWQLIPRTADVTVTKIAGYVRVHILMNR